MKLQLDYKKLETLLSCCSRKDGASVGKERDSALAGDLACSKLCLPPAMWEEPGKVEGDGHARPRQAAEVKTAVDDLMRMADGRS
jgi:hypothetical protein